MQRTKLNTSLLLVVLAMFIGFSSFSGGTSGAEEANTLTGKALMEQICSQRAGRQGVRVLENPERSIPLFNRSGYALDCEGNYYIGAAKYSGKNDELLAFLSVPNSDVLLYDPCVNTEEKNEKNRDD